MHNKTISYYNKNAKEFAERTVNADMGFAIANLLLYYIIKIILWMQVVEAEETVSFF